MTEVEPPQRGGTPRWENGTNVNSIIDEQDDMEDDLESNSAKLFERSRIKALAGWQWIQYTNEITIVCFSVVYVCVSTSVTILNNNNNNNRAGARDQQTYHHSH